LDAAVSRSRRDVALSRGITVGLSTLGVVLYLLGPGTILGSAVGPVVGTVAVFVAYFLAVQTPTGLCLWRIIDLFRLMRPILLELNRLKN
jgi:hypothetical protein